MEVEDEVINGGKVTPLHVLLDTGCTSSIILCKYVNTNLGTCTNSSTIKWTTMGGTYAT